MDPDYEKKERIRQRVNCYKYTRQSTNQSINQSTDQSISFSLSVSQRLVYTEFIQRQIFDRHNRCERVGLF